MAIVAKSAIKLYLSRNIDTHKSLKKVSKEKLMSLVQSYSRRQYLFKTHPGLHQLVGMLLVLKFKGFLLFYDMGLGKSKTFLDTFALLLKNHKVKKALVVVENIVNVDEFEEQVLIHTDLTPYQLLESKAKLWNALECDCADVYIIHYAGLVALVTSLQPVKGRDDRKRKRHLDAKLINRLMGLIQIIYIDESHNAKNRSSVTTKVLHSLCRQIEWRVGGSGTPMGKDPQDFYSQCLVVDRGITFGTSLQMFREVFYKKKKGYMGHIKWEFDPAKEKQLHRMLQHRSLWYEDIEVQDLPRAVDIPVLLPLSGDAAKYYGTVKEGLLEARGNVYEIKNSFMRLWQITSGFISWNSEDGSTFDNEFESAKMQWLESFLIQYMQSKKVAKLVIYHHFTHTGRRIEALLNKLGIEHASIRGEIKDKIAQKAKFKTQKDCWVLVANEKSGSTGLNLQLANKTVLYDIPLSLITFKQLLKRTRRMHQKRRTYFWYLLCKDTIDVQNLEGLQHGEELFSQVVKGATCGIE